EHNDEFRNCWEDNSGGGGINEPDDINGTLLETCVVRDTILFEV
ncbi:unnamed protein product, partial [Rotaria magnacalcarata]